MEKEKFINVRLSIDQNITYAMKMIIYIKYWEDILLHLSKLLLPQNVTFLEGFWPSSN
jgi:hypothetical protein